jgi:hypothetical protein
MANSYKPLGKPAPKFDDMTEEERVYALGKSFKSGPTGKMTANPLPLNKSIMETNQLKRTRKP